MKSDPMRWKSMRKKHARRWTKYERNATRLKRTMQRYRSKYGMKIDVAGFMECSKQF